MTVSSAPSKPRRRSGVRLSLMGVVIAIAALAAVILLRQNGSPTEAIESDPVNFAEVVVADLVREETFNGTLGFIADDPVVTQLAGTITEIAEKGDTIGQGEVLFAIDNQPVVLLRGELPAFRDIAISKDTVAISCPLDGTITWVAEPGAVIEQGDVLYRVDDQPVIALYGERPAYRNLGLVGPNLAVAEAQAALASAKANLTALTSPSSDQQIQAAQQVLNGAQQTLQDLLDLPDPDAVQIAQAQLANTEATLAQAQSAYDEVAWRTDLTMLPQSLQLQEATNNYHLAQAQYNQAVQGASPGEIANAQAQVAQARANLAALQEGPDPDALVAAEAQVEQAQVALNVLLAEAALAAPGDDVRQLEEALVALGYDPEVTVTVDDEFTLDTQEMVKRWQADIGAAGDWVVDFGEVVFLPGPAQVLNVLAAPGTPAGGGVVSVSTGAPTSGADVRQLKEALVDLGYDADGALVADGIYSIETNQAVLAFQAAAGLEPDGIINLGEVIFRPGKVRIINQLVTVGSEIGAGFAVLDVSLSDKMVRVDLPADEQGILSVGDAVTVEMPDLTEVPATVVFVSQTATPAADGSATFEVRIELDDPSVAAGLDEAPVDVIVVSDSVEDVMAIPVSALVALLEGGYAVEVDAGGEHVQLVAVEVGFFSTNNMIEIVSGALEPGDRVVVP